MRTTMCAALVVALTLAAGAPRALEGQGQSLPDLLDVVARYLDDFGRHADGVVIEEAYEYQTRTGVNEARRRVRADVAFLVDPVFGWIEFRDVIDVDGTSVGDRQARAVDLFSKASASAIEQVRRIIREGARFNATPSGVPVERTTNLPTAALRFFTRESQRRSRMRADGFDTVAGSRTAVVHFSEQDRPRMIGTPDDAAATGTVWTEPGTGRVRRTVMHIETRRDLTTAVLTMRVDFGPALDLTVWLPKSMEEDIVITSGPQRMTAGSIRGRATYTNYRKFTVTLEEKAGAPSDQR